jgi:hypothetical protein
MRTLAEQWQTYAAQVLPANASRTQRIETRRGFYAGAQALLALINGVSIDDVSIDQGAAMLELLHQELLAFGNDVQAGRA